MTRKILFFTRTEGKGRTTLFYLRFTKFKLKELLELLNLSISPRNENILQPVLFNNIRTGRSALLVVKEKQKFIYFDFTYFN